MSQSHPSQDKRSPRGLGFFRKVLRKIQCFFEIRWIWNEVSSEYPCRILKYAQL